MLESPQVAKKPQLSTRRRLFAHYRAAGETLTQAAKSAGYSERTAYSQGHRLMKNAEVKAEVERLVQLACDDADFTARDVLRALGRRIKADGTFDPRDFVDAHGNAVPLQDLPLGSALGLGGFSIIKRNLTAGDGLVDEIWKYVFRNNDADLKMGMTHHGLDVMKVDVTDKTRDLESRINNLRKATASAAAAKTQAALQCNQNRCSSVSTDVTEACQR